MCEISPVDEKKGEMAYIPPTVRAFTFFFESTHEHLIQQNAASHFICACSNGGGVNLLLSFCPVVCVSHWMHVLRELLFESVHKNWWGHWILNAAK